ncbi:hypothetical protein, partial [Paraconexibacter sp.]|uniref:hypothetical protein n=1 Tax=Paraconexibacter sp. TaxID=2949640 RepID=UPI003565040C
MALRRPTPTRPTLERSRERRTLVALGVAVAVAVGAAPAHAASPYNCDASALRGAVLGQPALEPVTANRGKPACANDSAGLADVLPAPLATSAVVAKTLVSAEGTPRDQQQALAIGGVADLRVSALPTLPITLPITSVLASLPTLPSIPVPLLLQPVLGAELSLDVKPALTALLPNGGLPNVDLVSVQAALAYAGARCTNGKAETYGTSQVVGLKVLGQDIVPGAAVDQNLNVIDTASVDPSSLDPLALLPSSALTQILGSPVLESALNTLLKPAIQAALDALPTIVVPATVANVKVTAGAKTVVDGILTQQALRVQASIAGQAIADVTLGEARVRAANVDCSPPPAAAPPAQTQTASELALQCTKRRLVLQDVAIRDGRVRLLGAADKSLTGKTVSIRFLGDGKRVATAKVRADGSFRTTARL